MNKAKQIIEKLQANEYVSRWDISIHRKEILRILRSNPDKYEDIFDFVLSELESCKESN